MAIIIEDAVAILNDKGEVLFIDNNVENIEITDVPYAPPFND